MNANEKKKKKNQQQYIWILFYILLGVICGVFIVRDPNAERTMQGDMLHYAGIALGVYAAIFGQTIIHEAGHLVFGLLSGYKFTSFRIFSLMWIKRNGKLRFGRYSLAGTGGQCLMAPPNMTDGTFPFFLYNLGGSFMNIIAGILFLELFLVVPIIPFFSNIFLFFAVFGFGSALMNGVPMRLGTVNNDGYNAFALTRSPEAMRSFWIQLKTNQSIADGVRLKDMPEEWFTVPSDEEMQNSMVSVMGVFACNRLMDALQFEGADKLMAHMLEIDSGMIDLYRILLTFDRMYIELITDNRREVLDGMRTPEQQRFVKLMKNSLSVLRTEYAYALLCEADTAKANRIQKLFEKQEKVYPYPNDAKSERELMEIAKQKFEAGQV